MTGYERDPTVDEVSRKEYLRKNRRRPVDEIVNELGEGRGMHMLSRGVAREAEHGLLTRTQESLLPVTRSAGPSALRPTTALTCRSPLHRRYVTYTQQYYSPCSNVLAFLRLLLRHGSRSQLKKNMTFNLEYHSRTTAQLLRCMLVSLESGSCARHMGMHICAASLGLGSVHPSNCLVKSVQLWYYLCYCYNHQALKIH